LFFLFCILFLSVKVCGQKKMHVIVLGMPERTFLTNTWDKEARPLLRKMPSYSMAPCVMVRHEIKKRWHLNYGILYSYQAQKFKMYFNSLNGHEGKTILTYLKIPLLLQFNLMNRETTSLFIQVGPQASFLVTEEGTIVNYADIVEAGGAYKYFVMDGVVSLGGEIKICKNLYYNLQLKFDHSLYHVNNVSYEDLSKAGTRRIRDVLGHPRSGEYNMSIGLLNGISFKIR
jgi:hypothetical protein